MAARLSELGHYVKLTALDDLHNYPAWRDRLDPGPTDVVASRLGTPKDGDVNNKQAGTSR